MSVAVLNFSHPLTTEQSAALAEAVGRQDLVVRDVPAVFDPEQALAGQMADLLDSLGIEPREWQTEPVIVVLPALSAAATVMLAALHGRMGQFPAIVRIVPQQGPLGGFRFAELIDLNAVRAAGRLRR